ncbi:MAG: alpha/beta fold hydrolase [Pseudobdellovibrionaceae bacterium]
MINAFTGKFKSFDGTEIYYESRGQGDPIVFVYGIACLMNHWHHQVSFFSKNYQVITFDLRGHHRSGIPEDQSRLNLHSIARDIPVLLRELGLTQAHFVGHSFGAQVLLSAYDQAPSIFKSITFVNGFAKNPLKGMFGLDVVEPFFHGVKNMYAKFPEILTELWRVSTDNPLSQIGAGLVGGFNLSRTEFKDIEIYARGVSHLSLAVLIPYFEDMMSFQGDLVAEKISCPALILSGDKDNVTPQKFQVELHERIKGSQFVVVPYGSHCTQLDFPDYTNLKIKEFIQSTK